MRIILVASVSTVKRLRVSLGTLVAIEAAVDPAAAGGSAAAFGLPAAAGSAAAVGPLAAAAGQAAAACPAAGAGQAAAAGPAAGAGQAAAAGPAAGAVRSAAIAAEMALVEAAVERAFEAIELVNRLMHPRAPGSDLARINSAPLHVPLEVHRSVGQLLNLARRINELTDGVFDPCTPAQPGRLNDIELSADETEVVCHAPVALDFGGIAKGHAVDCAIEALIASGCSAGLVNAGGDLRVFGQRNEPVFMRGPGGALTNIELTNAALAVSDLIAKQRPSEHQGYYIRGQGQSSSCARDAETAGVQQAIPHLIAPYAAVVASTAAVADALTKSVLLCSPPVIARALRAFGATQPLIYASSL